jgi:hypothetical protein
MGVNVGAIIVPGSKNPKLATFRENLVQSSHRVPKFPNFSFFALLGLKIHVFSGVTFWPFPYLFFFTFCPCHPSFASSPFNPYRLPPSPLPLPHPSLASSLQMHQHSSSWRQPSAQGVPKSTTCLLCSSRMSNTSSCTTVTTFVMYACTV